jgi:hypothetical protein
VVTILVLAQSGFLNEFHSPVDLTYLADTVINLRHFEARGAIRQAISVAKKRSGGHENTIREFKVSTKGLWVGEQLLQFRGVLTRVPVLESKPGALKKQETEDLDDDASRHPNVSNRSDFSTGGQGCGSCSFRFPKRADRFPIMPKCVRTLSASEGRRKIYRGPGTDRGIFGFSGGILMFG